MIAPILQQIPCPHLHAAFRYVRHVKRRWAIVNLAVRRGIVWQSLKLSKEDSARWRSEQRTTEKNQPNAEVNDQPRDIDQCGHEWRRGRRRVEANPPQQKREHRTS